MEGILRTVTQSDGRYFKDSHPHHEAGEEVGVAVRVVPCLRGAPQWGGALGLAHVDPKLPGALVHLERVTWQPCLHVSRAREQGSRPQITCEC